MPFVSVIVPVYNIEKYLAKCLDSLINQTFKDIEIICVNDGSTDNSLSIIEKYAKNDERIKVLNQPNLGVSVARNNGIKISTGRYIMFVDSDDYVHEDFVKIPYDTIEKESADIVCFGFNFEENNNISRSWNYELLANLNKKTTDNKDILSSFTSPIFDKIYSKNFLDKNNIKFPEGIKTNEDGIFNLKCFYMNPKIFFIKDCLYYYILNRTNSATQDGIKGLMTDFEAYKYIINSNEYQNIADDEYKKITIKRFINCVFYFYKKNNNIINKIKFALLLKEYRNYIYKTISPEMAEYCKQDLKSLNKIKIHKIIANTIFSVKNSFDKTHKEISFFGIVIRIARRKHA